MATKEAPKKEDPPAEEAPAPKKPRNKKLLIMGLAAVVVLLALGGAGAWLLLGKQKAEGADEATAAAQQEEEEAAEEYHFDPKKPPVFVNLEPFTVNLRPENGEQFLQLVATLRVIDEKVAEQVKLYMPQIRHEILASASAKAPSEVTTPEGREELAEEIKDITNEVLGYVPPTPPKRKPKDWKPPVGPVVSVFFTQFIVQ